MSGCVCDIFTGYSMSSMAELTSSDAYKAAGKTVVCYFSAGTWEPKRYVESMPASVFPLSTSGPTCYRRFALRLLDQLADHAAATLSPLTTRVSAPAVSFRTIRVRRATTRCLTGTSGGSTFTRTRARQTCRTSWRGGSRRPSPRAVTEWTRTMSTV